MCEGSNGGSDDAVSDHTQVSAGGHDHVEEGMGEPFEPFVCQICLDIAYKPIVLQACGHVFCFWCIRRSMNETKPSQCPVCRRSYLHFPRVCRLLHFLLEKAWPLHYQRKASETLAMEQTTAVFSPRILPTPSSSSSSSSTSSSHPASCTCHCGSLNAGLGHKLHVYPERSDLANIMDNAEMVSVEDVSCSACRKLLYRPVVINCGEALCEGCWKEREVARSNPRCGGGLHPRGPVRVCLPLHHYLERAFSSLYSQRRLDTPTPGENKDERQACDVEDGMVEEDDGFVHVGVGCDGCGMFPIVSRNCYHCVECVEEVGYDLCQSCYDIEAAAKVSDNNNFDKCSKEVVEDTTMTHESLVRVLSVGRFNQQHNLEHHLVAMVSTQRARPATFGAVLHFLHSQALPLQLNLHSGTISRRRHNHQLVMDDFDEYIDNLV